MSATQIELVGRGSLANLDDLVESYDPDSVLVVTGTESYTSSGARAVIESTLSTQFRRDSSVTSDPTLEEIRDGVATVRSVSPDVTVCIGGGSVMDYGKSITALAPQPHDAREYVLGERALTPVDTPVVAVPTTAGTGAEMTPFATIYVDREKHSLAGSTVAPDAAVVDPSLTESMSPYRTAVTGLDALCQSIESLWSVRSNPTSREHAKTGIELAWDALPDAVHDSGYATTTAMSLAAMYSGKAIRTSQTTACHSLAYPLTAYFDIPHGHAVALAVPALIRYNSDCSTTCIDRRGESFVAERMEEVYSLLDSTTSAGAAASVLDLLEDLGLEQTLTELDLGEDDISTVVENGFTPSRIRNNPYEVTEDDLRSIVEEMYA